MGIAPRSTSMKRESLALPVPYEAPDGELETLIARIFADIFGIDRVGANDDFFDVGGDSLLAETLSMAICENTGRDFPISSLVEFGSPRRIVALLTAGSGDNAAKTPTVAQHIRPPIFSVHGRDGFMLPKPAFLLALGESQKLRMFELPGIRSGRCYERIEDIAGIYVAQLTDEYPRVPILLSGFCMGSLIALEMAAQLAEKGRPVRMLVLIEPNIPENLVINDSRRKGNSVQRPLYPRSGNWLKEQGWRFVWELLCWLVLGRRTDGCNDEDFADKRLRYLRELKFRYKFWRIRSQGRGKHRDLRLSIAARAKLSAAYRHYRPRPFNGPAAILSSLDRRPMFESPSQIWADLLPQRRVYQLTEHHREMEEAETRARTARLMQSIFDAALADT